ncbi:spirocyclase AveC family protein [Williamsia sp. DF01-3]|uniref:spirocyclase AveC family protein n=1 Tax=Williamsia sp. DF01-3 TaxID=2934157 RepID=UPI001FF5D3C5|nr:spirocyclase AveC family protein [Williamsia sp. DF01-3]MCK0517336.1 spirocyclase AveC family protein [Williamsia sp. DF01-3]
MTTAEATSPQLEPNARSLWAYAWPTVGAAAILLQMYIFASWIAAGPTAPNAGPDPISDFPRYGLIVFQTAMIAVGIGGVIYIARTLWNRECLSLFQLVMIGWLCTWWQDPLVSMAERGFTYNSKLVNAGCWCDQVPGWSSENGSQFVEPLLITPPAYLVVLPLGALFSAYVIRWVAKRWSNLNDVVLFVIGWAGVSLLFQFPLELIATRLIHVDVWLSSPGNVSLWGDHFYKMPVYEFPLFGLALVTTGWVLYLNMRDGKSFLDVRLESAGISGRRASTMRVLAVIGYSNFSNALYIALFVIVSVVFKDSIPADTPSWLLYGRH